MPAGYPVKVNYLTGDVLTAANLNDLAGTVNLYDPTAKGDLFPASAADTVSRLAVGANDTVLTADSTTATGLKWAAAAAGAAFNTGYNSVATSENTTSTSYVNLATTQAVTVTTGTKALVSITAIWGNGGTSGLSPYVSFAVTGATTIAASDEYSGSAYAGALNVNMTLTRVIVLTGLTAGSNTFTLKFRDAASLNSYFFRRTISIVDLGS